MGRGHGPVLAGHLLTVLGFCVAVFAGLYTDFSRSAVWFSRWLSVRKVVNDP
jgi:hypothetical protein